MPSPALPLLPSLVPLHPGRPQRVVGSWDDSIDWDDVLPDDVETYPEPGDFWIDDDDWSADDWPAAA